MDLQRSWTRPNVAGQLSDKENQEVYDLLQQHPELLQEVLQIEAAVVKLTAAVSPHAIDFDSFKCSFA